MTTDAPAEPTVWRRRFWFGAAVLLVYSVLAVLIRLPVWQAPAARLGGTGGDPLQMAWFLSWLPHALSRGQNPFLTYQMNVPDGVNLLWNTSVPLAALVLWPITVFVSPFVTYNVLVTVSMAVGGWVAYLFIRRYASPWAAACGGLLYGFSPMMIAGEVGHAQVVASAMPIPVIALLLDNILVRRRRAWWLDGALLGLTFLAQFFIFEEFFVTALMAAATLVVVLMVVRRDQVRAVGGHALRAFAVAAAVLVVCLAYPLTLQLLGPDVVHGALHPASVYASDAVNFVVPTKLMWFAPSVFDQVIVQFTGNPSEQMAYLGIPLILILVAGAVWLRRSHVVQTAAAIALLVAIASLGPRLIIDGHRTVIPLPWIIPEHLKLLNNILPSRLTIYVFLAAAVMLAVMLDAVWRLRRRWWEPLALAVVALVLLMPKVPLIDEQVSIPQFFSSSATAVIPDDATVYAIPFPSSTSLPAMNGQVLTSFRYRILGGYFLGPPSPGQTALLNAANALTHGGSQTQLDATTVAQMRSELQTAHATVVMLTPMRNQAAVAAYLTTLFGAPAAHQGGIYIWVIG